MELPGCKLLILNTYFPQDTQNANFDEQDLLSCLTTIENLISSTVHDQVLVVGDLNYDFSRNKLGLSWAELSTRLASLASFQ